MSEQAELEKKIERAVAALRRIYEISVDPRIKFPGAIEVIEDIAGAALDAFDNAPRKGVV